MGFSTGRWEGDSVIVDTSIFNGQNWFDRTGNYHSDRLKLTETLTLQTPSVIHYEVTIDDPEVFTRPWPISITLYRRMEPTTQLLDYLCIELTEQFIYRGLCREQLVKRWESETMIIDVTRNVPPGDKNGAERIAVECRGRVYEPRDPYSRRRKYVRSGSI